LEAAAAVTRRKHPPARIDLDDYGFDTTGKGFRVKPEELHMLLGLDPLTCALYMRCLKPFADRSGAVRNASFYRFLQILTPAQSPCGGPRLPEPTRHQLERAIARLVQADLITSYCHANRTGRALQIRIKSASWIRTKL
jgi:hypothetical protein